MVAAEGLQVGRAVDVGDRRDRFVGVDDLGQLIPGAAHIAQVGHVGHGTPCREVGQDHLLVVARKDVGHLGHEVHAAEDDEFSVGFGSLG